MSIAPHLVVVGIGHVGSDVVTNAASLGLFSRISLIDCDEKVRDGQALDNHQATGVAPAMTTTVSAADYTACRDADVIIVAAGPSILPESYGGGHDSRNALAEVNSKVIREVMGGISRYTHTAPVILITNPLDVNVHIAATEFDYPTNLVVGTGTSLDSARLRRHIADRAGVSPDSVQAFILGEHGATAFPYLSHASIGGLTLTEASATLGFEPFEPETVRQAVVQSAFDVLEGKGWTSSGISRAAVSLARAMMLDQHSIHPVCTVADGILGFHGEVSLSLPAVVGAHGVERHLEISLDDWEREHLQASAQAVRAVYETVRAD
ncbi:lactate/malate family dehydrogenase [Acidipropionibacterium timonense]|uniref:lactate/malate family dehydrogenase n=1 Tax=Acidipropionibacterium timonense TaxID=2161818 RepID=UPI00102FA054|nr:lactate dehydrogenase [Acidipropionibacterium timonense]